MGRGGPVRVFAGLPLPSDVARSLLTALSPAREESPQARWVPAANLHVTLRFFGELDDAACAALGAVFSSKELPCPGISCRLGPAGQFPPRGAPRVLWVGLERGASEVHALWENLSRLLAPLEVTGGPLSGLASGGSGLHPAHHRGARRQCANPAGMDRACRRARGGFRAGPMRALPVAPWKRRRTLRSAEDGIARERGIVRAVDLIVKKRDGGSFAGEEIDFLVQGFTRGEIPDYQFSSLLMAIVLKGMSAEETARLTRAMIASGDVIDLAGVPGPLVDKHSTGGVGDKISLVLAPLAAACGLRVPMMSGRSLGHTGGTLDKLESIPGYRTDLSLDRFRTALRRGRLCDDRPERDGGPRGPAHVRPARRHGHGGIHPAHHGEHHVEEVRRGRAGARLGREDRGGCLHEEPRPGAGARALPRCHGRRAGAGALRRSSPTWTSRWE